MPSSWRDLYSPTARAALNAQLNSALLGRIQRSDQFERVSTSERGNEARDGVSTSDQEGAPRAAAAEDEEEDEGEDKMCIVCMDKPRATRFGCGHACCCLDCARTLKAMPEPQAVCPTCHLKH